MKKVILVLATLVLAQFSNADVCQIKTRTDAEAADIGINIYRLAKGDETVGVYTYAPIDFKYAVNLRNSLIKKGVCEKETELETCSIRIEPKNTNPVEVFIGEKLLTVYGGGAGVEPYSLNVAAKTIAMLKSAHVCK